MMSGNEGSNVNIVNVFNIGNSKYANNVENRNISEHKFTDMEIAAKETTSKAPTGLGYRHLQIALLFGILFFAYTLRVNISVGIVAMVSDKSEVHYGWDKTQQGLILSSFFWGYLVAQIAASHFAQRYGAKILLSFASIICSVLTLITPWAASVDWKLLLTTRALQGLFQGFFYPCVHTMLAKWVHPTERGLLTTITYSGTQLGSVVMLAISGILASSPMGWSSIFYVSGATTFLWNILWMLLGSNSPSQCARINNEEKKFIESMPGSSHQQLSTPWSKILTSVPVWALIIVHSTQCWGFWTLLTETPSYLKDVFDFDIKTNAILTSLPYLAMWIISLLTCPVSDYLINRNIISTRTGRKLFNSIGHWIPAIALIALPFVQDSTPAMILLIIAVGLDGCTYVGYMVNHMDLSPNFAGPLMGLTNTIANIMSIAGPLSVGVILTDSKDHNVVMSEWKLVFFIAAGFFVVGNLMFIIFGKAEIQPWNDVKHSNNANTDDEKPAVTSESSNATIK